MCVLLLWTLDAAVFVENSVDKHFGVIIVITNCRSKELTTKVMLNGEGIFLGAWGQGPPTQLESRSQ